MRLSPDTNTLIFFLYRQDELCADVKEALYDYANTLYTSVVCVHELMHLCMIGKIAQEAKQVLDDLESAGVQIDSVTPKHLSKFVDLPLFEDH